MITLPKKDFVDLNTSITAERLMRNGIDPNSITSVNQVENIINQLNKPKVVSQGDPRFKGIMDTMMGKNVIKRDFGKPFKEEIAKMESEATNPRFINYTIDSMKKMEPIDAMREANKIIKREGEYKNLSKEEAKKILDDTEDFIFERNIKPKETDITLDEASSTLDQEIKNAYNKAVREGKFKGTEDDFREYIDELNEDNDFDFATGGRVGLKAGMSRRAFLKLMGSVGAGVGAAKTGLLKILGKGASTPVVEKTAEAAGSAPPYFFKLVDKIKKMGDDVTEISATKEREVVTEYKDYRLTEDLATGEKTIQRIKLDSDFDFYDETLAEDVYMNYKPGKGQTDEATGKVADEYTEDTSYLRTSGPQKGEVYDTVEGIPDDVLEEIGEKKVISEKASGGIARMLGE
jgi:hypothetical protein